MSAALRPLEAARERDLWVRASRQRDPAAKEELVRAYLPLAARMARRYAGISEPFDDLFQVASLGLVNAVDRFDPKRGTPFIGFAKPTVLGEIRRHFRDKAWLVRVPRPVYDRIGKLDKATEDLAIHFRRAPSIGELSRHTGIEPAEILEAMEARKKRRPLSLDAPPPGEAAAEGFALDNQGEVDPGYDLAEERMMLAEALEGLTERERLILQFRFIDEITQSGIAELLGCSQMQISRELRSTLQRLREDAP
jgi:RNA polymerase sigma-B factor